MRNKRAITTLVIFIAVLSLTAAALGVFSGFGQAIKSVPIKSIYGEEILLYGKGIYHHDSVSVATQGISQDIVTMLLGIPLLLAALRLARKGSLKGLLLLTGTLGYFLYSYTSYSFLSMYNQLFLVYVALMSASLFAFILCMMNIQLEGLRHSFKEGLPVRLLGGFQLFIAFAMLMLWMGKIAPTLGKNVAPAGLEHYTTLVIQALDLGIIVPVAALSGILILQKRTFGYLLSSIVMIKGLTMLTALTAMIIGQVLIGVEVGVVTAIMFPAFNLIAIFCLMALMRNIDEAGYSSKRSA